MDGTRSECLSCLKINLREIRKLLKNVPDHKIDYLFQEVKEALYFYGFSRKEIEKMILYADIDLDHFNDERLLELQGVSNTILYQLKYKI